MLITVWCLKIDQFFCRSLHVRIYVHITLTQESQYFYCRGNPPGTFGVGGEIRGVGWKQPHWNELLYLGNDISEPFNPVCSQPVDQAPVGVIGELWHLLQKLSKHNICVCAVELGILQAIWSSWIKVCHINSAITTIYTLRTPLGLDKLC